MGAGVKKSRTKRSGNGGRRGRPAQTGGSRSNERLEDIVRHSAAVFARLGFHRAGMRDISRATGMSLAGLYYYFRSKDELLYLISSSAFGTLLEKLEAPFAATSDPAERLRVFVRQHLEYFLANKEEMKVISHEAQSLAPEFAAMAARKKQQYYKVLAGLVEDVLQAAGHAHPTQRHVRVATLSLFGMMNWIYNWHDPSRDGDARYLADVMTGIYLEGLCKVRARSDELAGVAAS